MSKSSNQSSLPRRIAKYGILGMFFGVGVIEAVSFLFFTCPCAPTMVRPEYSVEPKPGDQPSPPVEFGKPVTP
jgi:hypothetical protein